MMDLDTINSSDEHGILPLRDLRNPLLVHHETMLIRLQVLHRWALIFDVFTFMTSTGFRVDGQNGFIGCLGVMNKLSDISLEEEHLVHCNQPDESTKEEEVMETGRRFGGLGVLHSIWIGRVR